KAVPEWRRAGRNQYRERAADEPTSRAEGNHDAGRDAGAPRGTTTHLEFAAAAAQRLFFRGGSQVVRDPYRFARPADERPEIGNAGIAQRGDGEAPGGRVSAGGQGSRRRRGPGRRGGERGQGAARCG